MADESVGTAPQQEAATGAGTHTEAFFWSIVDAAPDGIVVVDADGRIRMVNEQVEELFGYRRRQLTDQFVEILLPDALRAAHRQHRDAFGADPRVRTMGAGMHLIARRADGSEFPVEVSLSPVRSGGDLFVVAAVRDITTRLEAERRLHESEVALQQAERALAVADDRERIARDLHDTVIQRIFAAGLSLQGVAARADGAVRSRIDAITGELDETIRDLRTAIFSLQTVDRSLSGLRGRLLDVVTEQGQALGFEPRLQFEGPIEAMDPSIADQMIPALREALANVARHARAHNVRVSIEAADEVTLTVIDDGAGVPDQVVGGRGTQNMRERAESLGGTCTLGNLDSGGARLEWRVPASPAALA